MGIVEVGIFLGIMLQKDFILSSFPLGTQVEISLKKILRVRDA